MDFAKTARNLAVADVALAFARDRLASQLPGVQPRKRRRGRKALLLGGVATAAAAAVLLKRDRVTALLPGRSDEPAPPEPAYTPPPVSNYDARRSGREHLDPRAGAAGLRGADDRRSRRGGRRRGRGRQHRRHGVRLRRPDGEPATPEELPLAEAGEGESEGLEQADAELRDAAEDREPA